MYSLNSMGLSRFFDFGFRISVVLPVNSIRSVMSHFQRGSLIRQTLELSCIALVSVSFSSGCGSTDRRLPTDSTGQFNADKYVCQVVFQARTDNKRGLLEKQRSACSVVNAWWWTMEEAQSRPVTLELADPERKLVIVRSSLEVADVDKAFVDRNGNPVLEFVRLVLSDDK